MSLQSKIIRIVLLLGSAHFVVACSPAPSGSSSVPAKKKDATTPTEGVDGGSGDGTGGVDGVVSESKSPCWEKIFDTPAVKACSGIYVFSAAACVTGFTKESSCTRDLIATKYGSAVIGTTPVMTSVDQWITEGFEPNQCATGSDGKFYAYFVKKTFTAAENGAATGDSYAIVDKKLGSSGAVLSSIALKSGGTMANFSCGDPTPTPSGSPSPTVSP